MGRAPCCDKANVKKGPWSPEEDAKLKDFIDKNGTGGNWIALPQKVGLKRCGKSCRLRWLNYLRPNIKHGKFSDAEDRIIITLYASIGSRWSIIASQLAGRTDNDIKNHWNTKLKKKLMAMNSSAQRNSQQNSLLSILENSSSSSPLSFNEENNSYYQPYSSNFLSGNSSNNTNFQAQESFMDPSQDSQFKDRNGVFVFGGEVTSSSSSDRSCNNQISYVMEPEFAYGGEVDGVNYPFNAEKDCGFWGENPLDYGLEEIKNLVSANNSCNNFLFDDKKSEESFMYY